MKQKKELENGRELRHFFLATQQLSVANQTVIALRYYFSLHFDGNIFIQQLHQEMKKRTTSVTNLRLSIRKQQQPKMLFFIITGVILFSLFIFISCVTTSPPLQRVFTFEMENTNTQQI